MIPFPVRLFMADPLSAVRTVVTAMMTNGTAGKTAHIATLPRNLISRQTSRWNSGG